MTRRRAAGARSSSGREGARVPEGVEHGGAACQHEGRRAGRECPQPSARVQSSRAFIVKLFEVGGFLAARGLKNAWLSGHMSLVLPPASALFGLQLCLGLVV